MFQRVRLWIFRAQGLRMQRVYSGHVHSAMIQAMGTFIGEQGYRMGRTAIIQYDEADRGILD